MTIALYFDEHVPRAVAHGLRLRGVDVITVQDDDRRGIADHLLLDRATELGRPLFSQDEAHCIRYSQMVATLAVHLIHPGGGRAGPYFHAQCLPSAAAATASEPGLVAPQGA